MADLGRLKTSLKPIITTGLVFSIVGLASLLFQQNNTRIVDVNNTNSSLTPGITSTLEPTSVLHEGYQASTAQLAEMIFPSLVRIYATVPGMVAVGSGFIIHESGFVITNQHLINGSSAIKVTLASGDSYAASVIDDDASRDLALIKITSTRTDLPVKIGSVSRALVGDALLIAAFPLELENSAPAAFTPGMVSDISTIEGLTYLQTDVSIDPGIRGGPVINLQGRLIGICVSAVTDPVVNLPGPRLIISSGEFLRFIHSGRVSCSGCH
jgi:S1-C subfamily serine protease